MLLTRLEYASKFHYVISPNRELVAFGMMNVLSCFFRAYPSFGSLSRTAVNVQAGARSLVSSIVTGLLLLITLLFLLPLFADLPAPVMSSIIFVAALQLLHDLEDIVFMYRISAWREMTLAALVFLVTLAASVETGVMFMLGVSVILVLRHSTKPRFTLMGRVVEKNRDLEHGAQDHVEKADVHNVQVDVNDVKADGAVENDEKGLSNGIDATNNDVHEEARVLPAFKALPKFKPLSEYPHAERLDQILMITLHEPLFFGNTSQLEARLQRLERLGDVGLHPSEPSRLRKPVKHIILDLENVIDIDAR